MTTEERNTLVEQAFHLIGIEARRPKSLPRGVSTDDLVSEGNEAVLTAVANFDPAGQVRWLEFARKVIRSRIGTFLTTARRRANRTTTAEVVLPDGSESPRPDRKAKDPADNAARREERSAGRKAITAAAIRAALPPPDQTALKAAAIRTAIFGAVSGDDMAGVMRAVLEKASTGDVKAAAFLVSTLAPPPPPPPPVVNVVLPPMPDDDDE